MSVGAVLTLGLGSFSDVNHVVTLGYGTGAAPTVQTVFVNVGGAGEPLSWEEAVLEVHKKRMLEERIRKYGKELKRVQKKIKVAAKKVKQAPVHPEGILANLWKLEERKEEIKLEVKQLREEVLNIETLLIAAQKLKEYEEEDEEEIEMLLLQ